MTIIIKLPTSLIVLLHYQLRGKSSPSASDPLRHHSNRQPYDLPSHEMRIVMIIMMIMDAMIFKATNIYYNQHHDISTVRTFVAYTWWWSIDGSYDGDSDDDDNDNTYTHDNDDNDDDNSDYDDDDGNNDSDHDMLVIMHDS